MDKHINQQSRKEDFCEWSQKRCRSRFRSPLHSTAVLNLNYSLVFFFKSFFYVLLAAKRTKSPGTGKISHNSLLLTSRKRHPSVGCYLPQTAVRSSIGDKTTRFSRNNSIAYMHRSDIFYPVSDACPAVCCDFDGAGFI